MLTDRSKFWTVGQNFDRPFKILDGRSKFTGASRPASRPTIICKLWRPCFEKWQLWCYQQKGNCHIAVFERWFLLLYSTNQKEMTLAAPGKKVQVKLLGGKQTTAPWTFSPGGYSGIVMALWPHDLLLFSKRNIWHWDQNSFAAVKWP